MTLVVGKCFVVCVDGMFATCDVKRKDERSWCGQDRGRTFCKTNWRRQRLNLNRRRQRRQHLRTLMKMPGNARKNRQATDTPQKSLPQHLISLCHQHSICGINRVVDIDRMINCCLLVLLTYICPEINCSYTVMLESY